jgi:predicted nuclease of predicted toxin-antitoxin system
MPNTCGNISNERLRKVLSTSFSQALELLKRGEAVVEISDPFA